MAIAGLSLSVVAAFLFGLVLIMIIGRIFFMPLKLVFKLVYNGIIGGLVLWVINFVGAPFDFTLAINPITALVVGLLGLPGVGLLIVFKVFFM